MHCHLLSKTTISQTQKDMSFQIVWDKVPAPPVSVTVPEKIYKIGLRCIRNYACLDEFRLRYKGENFTFEISEKFLM